MKISDIAINPCLSARTRIRKKKKIKIQDPKRPRSRPVTNWPVTYLIPPSADITDSPVHARTGKEEEPIVCENHQSTSHTPIRLTPKRLKYHGMNPNVIFILTLLCILGVTFYMYSTVGTMYNVRGTVQGSFTSRMT